MHNLDAMHILDLFFNKIYQIQAMLESWSR